MGAARADVTFGTKLSTQCNEALLRTKKSASLACLCRDTRHESDWAGSVRACPSDSTVLAFALVLIGTKLECLLTYVCGVGFRAKRYLHFGSSAKVHGALFYVFRTTVFSTLTQEGNHARHR